MEIFTFCHPADSFCPQFCFLFRLLLVKKHQRYCLLTARGTSSSSALVQFWCNSIFTRTQISPSHCLLFMSMSGCSLWPVEFLRGRSWSHFIFPFNTSFRTHRPSVCLLSLLQLYVLLTPGEISAWMCFLECLSHLQLGLGNTEKIKYHVIFCQIPKYQYCDDNVGLTIGASENIYTMRFFINNHYLCDSIY